MLKGLLAGGITLGIAAVFPEPLVFPFFAVILGLMAGVGPGLAMRGPGEGRPSLQWIAAFFFVGMGLVGLWVTPLLLAGAWLLHGIWSFLHQITGLRDDASEEFFRFSLTFDLVVAGFLAYMWAVGV